MPWVKWYDKRPPNEKGVYRWRVKDRNICGMTLSVEWTEDLGFCGMGYADNEWWPHSSGWDGWTRTVDRNLEWRPLVEAEIQDAKKRIEPNCVFHGLDLLPCPFTGEEPRVVSTTSYIGAPPYKVTSIGIQSWLVHSYGWSSAKKMQEAWNRRDGGFNEAFKASRGTVDQNIKLGY